MVSEKLTENNFLLFAMHHYDNPQCHSVSEFEEDVKRFLYLKKLFTRYYVNDDLKERLVINHIIVLYNIFGDATTNMLFYKVEEKYWPALVTFLVYLNRMPEYVAEHSIRTSDVILDEKIIKSLRKI